MNWVNLADLDELVLLCKDEDAKKYILEAVNCYRGGAFRATIVLTWIAVVYDVIGKLRQLTLLGDGPAKVHFDEFEKYRANSDKNSLLNFEKKVLSIARELEFITELELRELERLPEDRNYCAHPSMNSLEQTYNPNAELARYHLRNAVLYLIQYFPVNGKTALPNLEKDVKSPRFPIDKQRALDWFKGTTLVSARQTLVRSFGTILLKNLILNTSSHHEAMKYAAALNAVREMYFGVTEQLLQKKLGDMINSVEESDIKRVVRFVSLVPDTWRFLSQRTHILLNNYINDLPSASETVEIFEFALEIPELKNEVIVATSKLYPIWQIELIQVKPIPEFKDLAINLYQLVNGYAFSREVGSKCILPLLPLFSDEQINSIITIAAKNDQIFYSVGEGGLVDVLRHIKELKNLSNDQFKQLIEPLLKVREDWWLDKFPELFPEQE